jgi:undecaprenyl-diphosphatase
MFHQLMAPLGAMNLHLFRWINTDAGSQPLWDRIGIFCAEAGPYLLMLIFIIGWFYSDDNKKSILIEATEASLVGLFLNQLIGFLYFHPRPYMVGLCIPLIPHAPETSFPSDHGTLLFTASVYLIGSRGCRIQGLALFLVAFIAAWARVYCGIHFPFDMVGSLAVGTLSALFIFRIKSRISPLNQWMIRVYGKGSRHVRSTIDHDLGRLSHRHRGGRGRCRH